MPAPNLQPGVADFQSNNSLPQAAMADLEVDVLSDLNPVSSDLQLDINTLSSTWLDDFFKVFRYDIDHQQDFPLPPLSPPGSTTTHDFLDSPPKDPGSLEPLQTNNIPWKSSVGDCTFPQDLSNNARPVDSSFANDMPMTDDLTIFLSEDFADYAAEDRFWDLEAVMETNKAQTNLVSTTSHTDHSPERLVSNLQYPIKYDLPRIVVVDETSTVTPELEGQVQYPAAQTPLTKTSVEPGHSSPQSNLDTPSIGQVEVKKSNFKRKRKSENFRARKSGREREVLASRFCFHQMSDPNLPTEPEYRKYTDFDLDKKRALLKQGGACVRCRIEHRTCDGGNPCTPCLDFWNANQMSRTIIWNDCVRSKLRDVSPFAQRRDQGVVWSHLIKTSYFYDVLQEQKASGLFGTHEWPSTNKCPYNAAGRAGHYVRDATKEGHCTFTAKSHGLDFYYSILALLSEYNGCPYSFEAVIETAGARALQALDNLMNLREFEKKQPMENCGLLICLFYGLIALQRLKHRCERSRSSRMHLWEEYKNLNIDLARLKTAQRILGHFFVIVCERLDVAGEEWYGQKGQKLGTHGFQYVMGICKFVSTFELESDLFEIKELLKGLPIIADRDL